MMKDKRTFGPKPNYPRVEEYERPDEHKKQIRIAGPCSIESRGQINEILDVLQDENVTYARGGPWSYGTYPPEDSGLRLDAVNMFCSAAKRRGMKSIIECLDIRDLSFIAKQADAIQIGARQMQNYPLLEAVGSLGGVVTLKRHVGCTVDELLGACEYLLKAGDCKPILIERGIASFNNHVRWGVDITSIAHIAKYFDIPILVDASHGTGRRDLVKPVLSAGLAAGASGFLIETHPNPDKSWSDSEQAYPLGNIPALFEHLDCIYSLSGKKEDLT